MINVYDISGHSGAKIILGRANSFGYTVKLPILASDWVTHQCATETCTSHDRAKACFSINPTAEIVAYTLSHDSTKNALKIKHFWPKNVKKCMLISENLDVPFQ